MDPPALRARTRTVTVADGPSVLASLEAELVFFGEGVGHSTAALVAWHARQPDAEEQAARVK